MRTYSDKETRDYYNSYSDVYALIWSQQMHTGYFKYAVTLDEACADMNRHLANLCDIKKDASILSVGCGRGGTDRFLANQFGVSVTGIDISERQLEEAIRNAKINGLEAVLKYKHGSMTALPVADASFDYIWVQEALFHCHSKDTALREFYRVLKSGGRIIIEDTILLNLSARAEVMSAFGQRVHINYLNTPEEYENIFRNTGFYLVKKEDLTDHLIQTYRAIADYIALHREKLKQKIDRKYWPTLENDNARARTLKLAEEHKLGCVAMIFVKD